MPSSEWNWSWVKSRDETLKASNTVDQSGGTLYTYKAPAGGQLQAKELKASMATLSTNINHQWRLWRSHIRPILDSLPSGTRDQRWRPGRGLPDKIDALGYGIQGTTLFISNDASTAVATGRYWDEEDERPKTIAEGFEDVWTAISALEISSDAAGSVDLTDVWLAIGNRLEPPMDTKASASYSLDAKLSVVEGILASLEPDIYGGIGGYGYGVPLEHSIAKNIDRLLKIHEVTGWQHDPDGVGHAPMPVPTHTHLYSSVGPPVNTPAARGAAFANLENDLNRIRWEIARTRGSSDWQSDVISPWQGGLEYTSLGDHLYFNGAGTPSATNPHGIDYTDTGADVIFNNVANFIGMVDPSDIGEVPNYSSAYHITQGGDLVQAISELDFIIHDLVEDQYIRRDYSYDRTHLSETEREETVITINHNVGRKPIVQVLDVSDEYEDYWGDYVSSPVEVDIIHTSVNTFQIWTGAAKIEVVAIF